MRARRSGERAMGLWSSPWNLLPGPFPLPSPPPQAGEGACRAHGEGEPRKTEREGPLPLAGEGWEGAFETRVARNPYPGWQPQPFWSAR